MMRQGTKEGAGSQNAIEGTKHFFLIFYLCVFILKFSHRISERDYCQSCFILHNPEQRQHLLCRLLCALYDHSQCCISHKSLLYRPVLSSFLLYVHVIMEQHSAHSFLIVGFLVCFPIILYKGLVITLSFILFGIQRIIVHLLKAVLEGTAMKNSSSHCF